MDNVTSFEAIKAAKERFGSTEKPKRAKQSAGDLGPMDVARYLTDYGVSFTVKADPERTIYVLRECLFDSSHTGKESSIIQAANGTLYYQCFHDSCGHTWAEARQKISGAAKLAKYCEGYKEGKPTTAFEIPTGDFALTDLGNAERFARDHQGNVRYCYPLRQWYVWNDKLWSPDEGDLISRLAKTTVRRIAHEVGETAEKDTVKAILKHAIASEKRDRIAAMLALTQSEEGIPVASDDLDADPWLLNTLNGVLDLKTAKLLPHNKDFLITKTAPVVCDYNAACPRFTEFLHTIMDGREDLIVFLQKLAGYSLTGDTSEQIVIFFYGTGENGKSTLLETLSFVMGDFAKNTPIQTFLLKKNETIANDLAALKGARFVTASEPEVNQTLAEAAIKQVTGGDKVSCRFLYREWFEYVPSYKVFISTNHRLRIRGTDHAIWRRIREIPFTVRIPKAIQDKHLLEKLKAEAPGILNWALEGCLMWQSQGLDAPEAVVAATADYRNEQDLIGSFLIDCCLLDPRLSVTAADFRYTYTTWCEDNGEKPLSAKAVGALLRERGCTPNPKVKGQRGWNGIGLVEKADILAGEKKSESAKNQNEQPSQNPWD
jgi:putative DNA primase/helicase